MNQQNSNRQKNNHEFLPSPIAKLIGAELLQIEKRKEVLGLGF